MGGHTITSATSSYTNLRTKAIIPAVAANKVVGFPDDANMRLKYLSIDDVGADLQPIPFFVKTVEKANPSGYDIIAKSKPLPIPHTKAIVELTVA